MSKQRKFDKKSQNVQGQPTAEVQAIEKQTPPLKPGERLSRKEFERRYDAMPHLKKAELIEGVVYAPSPIRMDIHGRPHAYIMGWLVVYRAGTPGVDLGDNATVRLDDNEVQPDALLRIEPACGGASQISDDGYIEGPPELIVEIAATSTDYDLHEKFEVYRRSGVKEYLVWRTQEAQLDWFRLVEGRYVRQTPDEEGVIESQILPGLRLKVEALLKGDLAAVLAELQNGLQTAEHAAFARRLSA